MVKKKDSLDDDLVKIRNKLKRLNQRVRAQSPTGSTPSRARKSKSKAELVKELKDVSLEEMRAKLSSINSFLKKKLGPEKLAPAKEVVTEAVESQFLDETDNFEEPISEEIATQRLPQAAEEEVAELEEAPVDQPPQELEPVPAVTESPQESQTPQAAEPTEPKAPDRLGVGFDLGTAYLVAAREVESKKVFVKNERNAFLSVRNDPTTVDLLKKLKIKYADLGDNMYVIGNLALSLANVFNREVQRSMNKGIINPSEAESIPVIKLIVQHILWEAREKGEVCCFSIPADPIDREQDTIYHRGVFEAILREIDYDPIIIDEGYAVVLSELEYKDFTGIGVSCGAGMVNVCAAYRSVPALSFSITRGGDWIDESAAKVLGVPISKVTTTKEQGMSLLDPKNREEEAIALYYKNYIRYFLESLAQVFSNSNDTPQFKEPLDIVFAGGSALVKDFITVVKEELKTIQLGIPIGEVKRADEPFTSVSRGCLFNAINSDKYT